MDEHQHAIDRIHAAYHGVEVDAATHQITQRRVHWIVDHVPAGHTVDIGCSQGVVPILLALRGDSVLGVDIVEEAILFAQERASELPDDVARRLSFMVADGVDLPLDDAVFDAAVITEVLEHAGDPGKILSEARRVLRPGGTLVLTVPFGLLPHDDHHRVFYHSALESLLEPMFDVVSIEVLDKHLAVTASPKATPSGEPILRLSQEQQAVFRKEQSYEALIHDLREKLATANAKYRQSTEDLAAMTQQRNDLLPLRPKLTESERQRSELTKVRGELQDKLTKSTSDLRKSSAELQSERTRLKKDLAIVRKQLAKTEHAFNRSQTQLDSIKASHAFRLISTYWGLARRVGRGRPSPRRAALALPASSEASTVAVASPEVAEAEPAGTVEASKQLFLALFDEWVEHVRRSSSPEVVIMFSGTTYVQEQRGNRPIRLTKIFLNDGVPVFFNYYRWRETDPLPDYPDKKLFQSPIDWTPDLLNELLDADLGPKQKILFVSFPHESMVRSISRARQRGWSVVYDARDDWEAFARVGMANWYLPSYERFVTREADVVTAVARPLALKLARMSDRDDILVSPNALDVDFPRRERQPSQPPIAGYFGHLTDRWFDWDLLIATALAMPSWRFELAGHQAPELELPANVVLVGLLSHEEIAQRAQAWSVGIIPFVPGLLSDGVDPIKVYEYLHLGLPVVSSFFPQMSDYPGVTMVDSPEHFVQALEAAADEPLNQDEVDQWLAANTWRVRVDGYRAAVASSQPRTPLDGLLQSSV